MTASVHPASIEVEKLRRHCDVTTGRRSGPGGQHRNKVETAVTIKHRPTGITAEASERRSQLQNQKEAWQRLRINLALKIRIPRDECSPLWLGRIRKRAIQVNLHHEDYPSMLAEAMDVIAHHAWESVVAAETLGVSHTQLIKFLSRESQALAQLNEHRKAAGLSPLRGR